MRSMRLFFCEKGGIVSADLSKGKLFTKESIWRRERSFFFGQFLSFHLVTSLCFRSLLSFALFLMDLLMSYYCCCVFNRAVIN